MPEYLRPGVYTERVDASSPAISAVRTDVAGFVGIAQSGPLDTPVPIQSFRQFQAHFGDFTGQGYLAYAVRGFFENGGQRCWVVRVASKHEGLGAKTAGVILSERHRLSGLSQPITSVTDARVFNVASTVSVEPGMLVEIDGEPATILDIAGNQITLASVLSRTPKLNDNVVPIRETPVWRVTAANPGAWGNQLSVAVQRQRSAQANLDPLRSTLQFGSVSSVAGFQRGSLVRLSQAIEPPPAAPAKAVTEQWRVVSAVDARAKRLYWVHPEPGAGLPYDAPVTGFDPNGLITVDSLNYRLLVFREDRLLATYSGLSLIPEHPNYGPLVLPPAEYPVRLRSGNRLPVSPPPVAIEELRPRTTDTPAPLDIDEHTRLVLQGGSDGLNALSISDFLGEEVSPRDSEIVKARKIRGIEALNLVDEIAVVAVPDIVIRPEPDPVYQPDPPEIPDPCIKCPPPPEPQQTFRPRERAQELPPLFSDDEIFQVQAALVQHCQQRCDRFAVLDPPFSAAQDDTLGIGAIQAWRSRFDNTYAALFYPWLKIVEPRRTSTIRRIPPSGHVVGQFAAQDQEVGVHAAAANRPLAWTQDVSIRISDGQHEVLNPLSINAIRDELGRGLRIMGARTLSSDPDWRYINVRRLILMIRKAVDVSTQWAAFEPNHNLTRNKLILALSSFLIALWQRGALVGATAEQSFFVKCDEENNPPHERVNGKLVAHIGVAPSKPLEFVVLRVGRQGNEMEIAEAGFIARVA